MGFQRKSLEFMSSNSKEEWDEASIATWSQPGTKNSKPFVTLV